MDVLKSSKFWLGIVFAYLVLRLVIYISIINQAAWPDYDYHLAVLKIYKTRPQTVFFWQPKDVGISCFDRNYYNPPVSTEPFLYYSIVGKIWFLFEKFFHHNALMFTAFLQGFFGLLTIYYGFQLVKLVTSNKLVRILTLATLSTLPMFGFVMAYPSYDNLVNLFSAMSIYYLVKFVVSKKIPDAIIFFTVFCLGSLSKITYLPLGLILLLIFLLNLLLNQNLLFKNFFVFLKTKKNYWLLGMALVSFSLMFVFYGRNIFYYGTYRPVYDKYSERNCSDKQIQKIREETLNLSINQIRTEDSNDIVIEKNIPLRIIKYFEVWVIKMTEGIFNIVSHKSLVKGTWFHRSLFVFFIMALVGLFRRLYNRKNKLGLLMILITVFYAAVLFFYVNLRTFTIHYASSERYSGIQGRYLFPVLGPLVVMFSYGLVNFSQNHKVRIILILVFILLMLYADLFFFLRHYHLWL